MKIVIVSRLIYPNESPRPLRATELAKSFARMGHEVKLYGVLGDYDYSSFQKEFNLSVKPIGKTYFSTLKSSGNQKQNLFSKISSKLFGKIFELPNLELAFKMGKILKNEKNIDLLITIAIPYGLHWGMAWQKTFHKKRFPTKWISDCGDPFMGNPFKKHPFYFKYIEKWWGKKTDAISVPTENAKQAYYPEVRSKIYVIPQGFDFSKLKKSAYKKNSIPTFIYAGAVYKDKRDPTALLDYLASVKQDFKFIVYSKNPELFKNKQNILKDKLEIRKTIPRKELIYELSKSDFLINIKNIGTVQSPSKLIDYFYVERPIINVSSQFPAEEKKVVEEFLSGNYQHQVPPLPISKFNIDNIATQFLNV